MDQDNREGAIASAQDTSRPKSRNIPCYPLWPPIESAQIGIRSLIGDAFVVWRGDRTVSGDIYIQSIGDENILLLDIAYPICTDIDYQSVFQIIPDGSGVYLYRLTAGKETLSRKMILLR
jgi:hypothetical protein